MQMKLFLYVSIFSVSILNISYGQKLDPKKIQFKSSVDELVSMYNADNNELIGQLPLTIDKSEYDELTVTFKANNMLNLTLLIPIKDVLVVNIMPSNKAKLSSSSYIPISDIQSVSSKTYDVVMIPLTTNQNSELIKLSLLPTENKIPPSTPVGREQSGTVYKTIDKGVAYDPIFGTSKNQRRNLCNLLNALNVFIIDCDAGAANKQNPTAKSQQYTTVKPVIENFSFKQFTYKNSNGFFKYGYYNLKMKYVFSYSSGISEEIEIINYGFYNAPDPNTLYNKALTDNISICLQNTQLVKNILESNEAYKNVFGTKRLKIKKTEAKAADMKDIIKKSKLSVVTIDGADNSFGSGFLINDSGYILTNYHVVEGADKIGVRISKDTATYSAELIQYDEFYDLALIKIQKTNTPYLILSETEEYDVGDGVIAIGTPAAKELEQSVSKGIISGIRKIETRNYIQTDVSINPGNSGGPLIDDKGTVVGIIVMKISGRGYEGLGFAIPSKLAIELMSIEYVP